MAADEIERITVAVPDPGIPLVLEPRRRRSATRAREYDAKFSLQYSIAALLVHGRVGVETYTEQAIRDPAVLALAARVEHVRRPFPTYPQSFPGWVRIETRAGAVLERELRAPARRAREPDVRGGGAGEVPRERRARPRRRGGRPRSRSAVLSLEQQDDLGTRVRATPQPASCYAAPVTLEHLFRPLEIGPVEIPAASSRPRTRRRSCTTTCRRTTSSPTRRRARRAGSG